MISHDEASDLLGAYALDAVDADEAEAVEEHVLTCPRCRDELRNHREVVGVLAYAGQEAPAGLWDRVAARIHDPVDTEGPPGAVSPPAPIRLGRGPGRSRSGGSGGSGPWAGRRLVALAAAAAVVIVALLGVEVVRLQGRTDHLSHQIASMADYPSMTTVQRALAAPGARQVLLRPVRGSGSSLEAVILPGGQGYLYDPELDPLSSSQTYQLWGIEGTERISYAVLGSEPAAVMAFRAGPGVQALAVTTEVAGGVVASTKAPVVVGLLS